MVWMPGGGNFTGDSADPRFDGTSLAQHGIVLVSVNYRLGILGFFAHPALLAESPHHAAGNYGLLDQVAALQWVHDNVARFGGDPSNVTLFGESAGALDIDELLTSPLTTGLFRKMIVESGPAVPAYPLSQGLQQGEDVAAKLQISGPDTLARLRALSRADLWKIAPPGLAFLGPQLGVVIDGWVLPQSPFAVYAAGKEHPVQLLIGNNARELSKPFFPAAPAVAGELDRFYGPLAPQAHAIYGVTATGEPPADPVYGDALAQFATDTQFRCGTIEELGWHTKAGYVGYEFQFDRIAPGNETTGAKHASELPYVFGTLPANYGEVDHRVSAEMQTYWTSFAKTENPNDPTLPAWPRFDPQQRAYMEFTDTGPVSGAGLRRAACDLYAANVQRVTGVAP